MSDEANSDRGHSALPLLQWGDLSLDLECGIVRLGEKVVALTRLEERLLLYLAQNRSRPVPVDELLQAVWGTEQGAGGTPDQVKSCVKRLRRKIEAGRRGCQVIVTVRGAGYMLGEPTGSADRRETWPQARRVPATLLTASRPVLWAALPVVGALALGLGLIIRPWLHENVAEARGHPGLGDPAQPGSYATLAPEETPAHAAATTPAAVTTTASGIEVSAANFRRQDDRFMVDICFALPDDSDWTIWVASLEYPGDGFRSSA